MDPLKNIPLVPEQIQQTDGTFRKVWDAQTTIDFYTMLEVWVMPGRGKSFLKVETEQFNFEQFRSIQFQAIPYNSDILRVRAIPCNPMQFLTSSAKTCSYAYWGLGTILYEIARNNLFCVVDFEA